MLLPLVTLSAALMLPGAPVRMTSVHYRRAQQCRCEIAAPPTRAKKKILVPVFP
jgi:hypothetical protein